MNTGGPLHPPPPPQYEKYEVVELESGSVTSVWLPFLSQAYVVCLPRASVVFVVLPVEICHTFLLSYPSLSDFARACPGRLCGSRVCKLADGRFLLRLLDSASDALSEGLQSVCKVRFASGCIHAVPTDTDSCLCDKT